MLKKKKEVGSLGMNLTRSLKSVPFSVNLRLKKYKTKKVRRGFVQVRRIRILN